MFIDDDPFFKLALIFVAGVALFWGCFQLVVFLRSFSKSLESDK
jgi:hypothetical protein